jgi:hypothetical protein
MDRNGASSSDAGEARQCSNRLGRQSPQGTVGTGKNFVADSDCGILSEPLPRSIARSSAELSAVHRGT